MPLFHHAGALGDFLLSLPFLRAARSHCLGATWALAAPEAHARLVSRIFPHQARVAPGSSALAPLTARGLDPGALADLASRYGGLFGFLPRAATVEAQVRSDRPDLAVGLVEPFSSSISRGVSIEAVLKEAIGRLAGEQVQLGPESFAIHAGELPGADPSRVRPESGPFALLHPGAGDPAKQAPLELFVQISRFLEGRGIRVEWVRGPVEVDRGDPEPPGPALDRPDLISLAVSMTRAAIHVGNDSGPTHLASALGTPALALHAVPNPAWRPRGRQALVCDVRRGSAEACASILELLEAPRSSPSPGRCSSSPRGRNSS